MAIYFRVPTLLKWKTFNSIIDFHILKDGTLMSIFSVFFNYICLSCCQFAKMAYFPSRDCVQTYKPRRQKSGYFWPPSPLVDKHRHLADPPLKPRRHLKYPPSFLRNNFSPTKIKIVLKFTISLVLLFHSPSHKFLLCRYAQSYSLSSLYHLIYNLLWLGL